MISPRLTEFLASLTRLDAVPVADVERMLLDAGGPVPPIWLDFHERYAGYVLELGDDSGVLGLAHERGTWLEPHALRLFRRQDRRVWGIACADIHPSYEYVLDTEGEFVGGPAESFDVYIEQFACIWTFTKTKFRGLPFKQIRSPEFRAEVLARASLEFVAEASDRYSKVWMDDRYLVVDNPETSELKDGWQRLD